MWGLCHLEVYEPCMEPFQVAASLLQCHILLHYHLVIPTYQPRNFMGFSVSGIADKKCQARNRDTSKHTYVLSVVLGVGLESNQITHAY